MARQRDLCEHGPAATQLTVTHPGGPAPFAFPNPSFLTTPTTGFYVSATHNLADANVLTFDLVSSNPADGSAFTATGGGAIVNRGVASVTQR